MNVVKVLISAKTAAPTQWALILARVALGTHSRAMASAA